MAGSLAPTIFNLYFSVVVCMPENKVPTGRCTSKGGSWLETTLPSRGYWEQRLSVFMMQPRTSHFITVPRAFGCLQRPMFPYQWKPKECLQQFNQWVEAWTIKAHNVRCPKARKAGRSSRILPEMVNAACEDEFKCLLMDLSTVYGRTDVSPTS